MNRLRPSAVGAATAVLAAALLPAVAAPANAGDPDHHHGHHGHHHGHHHHYGQLRTVTALDGPRGVDNVAPRRTLVTEADGSFSLVVERRHKEALVIPLGQVPPGFLAPAIAATRDGTVYILTVGGEPGTGAATLYTWRKGDEAPTALADIAAYQAADPDPYDLEDAPEESNPYGLAVLRDGSAVVADAAGNDVLKVTRDGEITTIARLKPRTVAVPEYLPDNGPDGEPLPPAGTMMPSEAVATSVAVGKDGSIYVGELRGFPATPRTSQVWRIAPGAEGVVCDPERPWAGACKRYADGLTSIVDLAVDRHGTVFALSLSKKSWLAWELGVEGSEIGALHALKRHHGKLWRRELFRGQLENPSGVDVGKRALYLVGPIFGPGALSKAAVHHHHRHHHRHHH